MTYIPTQASRTYSSPPSTHNLGMNYLWDPDYVTNGMTGNWRPIVPDDYAHITAVVAITGVTAIITGGTYTSTLINLTSQQVVVPIGVKSLSVAVESGTAYINGTAFNAGVSLNLGGYDGRFLSASTYTVGITGGRAYVAYE